MKLGLYVDLRNPPPWRRDWVAHYRHTLELVERAEELGAGSVWLSEHHFFDDGYLPQPLTFAAAIAARTRRMRIGTAILLAALRHPIHVAEEAAVVDLISGGRLELGIGAGYVAREYAAFGVDLARRFRLTDAAATRIRELLYDGGTTPPPAQARIPFWLGYQGPQGARRAGRAGMGLLSLDAALLAPYREGLVDGGHPVESARTGGMLDIVVADDPPAALARILPHYAHQLNSYRAAAAGDRPPREVSVPELAEGIRTRGRLPGLRVLGVDEAVTAIREHTEGLPVEHVYLWASVAGMPDDLVQRHLELTFTRVAPALATAASGPGGTAGQTAANTGLDHGGGGEDGR